MKAARRRTLTTLPWVSSVLGGHRQRFAYSSARALPFVPISEFKIIEDVPLGSHEVWKAEHRPTGITYFLKCPTVFREQIAGAQERGQSFEDVFADVTPEAARYTVEKEMFATRVAKLFLNNKAVCPETVMCVKTDDCRHSLIASQEVPGYQSLEEFGNSKGEMFFVGKNGETRLWKKDEVSVANTGRIAAKLAGQLPLCWTDKNKENFGFVPLDGENYKAALIDFGECLERCRYADLTRQQYAQLLASGDTESPIPEMDLRGLNITRRKTVREEVIRHVAGCAKDGTEIRKLFNGTFSFDYPAPYRRKIEQVARTLHHNLEGFVLADHLLSRQWDGTEKMAGDMFAAPECHKEIINYRRMMQSANAGITV